MIMWLCIVDSYTLCLYWFRYAMSPVDSPDKELISDVSCCEEPEKGEGEGGCALKNEDQYIVVRSMV